MDHDFIIDGRSTYEETHWWNPELRQRNNRPGPGVLPPLLTHQLHDSNCSLFSVNVTVPSISPLPLLAHSPPTEEEFRTSIPHPNACYCPKNNGWVILSWNSSSLVPPLARSYIASGNPPLPDQVRRRWSASCIEEGDQPFGKTNETHHFHKYEKAVDSHKLTPPYRKEQWKSLETVKQRRRVGTILTTDSNTSAIKADDVETLCHNIVESAEEEDKLLDLYVCCQCSFYCVASGVIPGVIPPRHLEELVRDRKGHSAVGMSAEQSTALAVHTVLT
jgi:ubiquitin carboxyl-terminal hydrolase 25